MKKRGMPRVRLNQVWIDDRSGMRVQVIGKRGDRFLTRKLTDRHGVYGGSHTVSVHTLFLNYRLME